MSCARQLSISHLDVPLRADREQLLSNVQQALQSDLRRVREEIQAEKAKKRAAFHAVGEFTVHETVMGKQGMDCLPYPPNTEQRHYCTHRPPRSGVLLPYNSFSTGRPCTCTVPHFRPLRPRAWQCTPTEEPCWDYTLPNGGHPIRENRVKFAEDPVSEVRESEKWYREEYVESDRYWDRGPVKLTRDGATEEDDEREMVWLEAMEKLEELDIEDIEEVWSGVI